MFLSLIFALTLSVPGHASVALDTVPKSAIASVGSQGQAEIDVAKQIFHDHYDPGYYPPFEEAIIQIAPDIYRLDSFTIRIDSLPTGMTGLLSRGLLFPGRLAPWFGSTDTMSIGNLYELKGLSPSPRVRRFSCLVRNSRILNACWYVFELINDHGNSDMDMAVFIQEARLTFLYQVSVLL